MTGKNLKEGTIHASPASLQEETMLLSNVTKGACPCRAFLLFHSEDTHGSFVCSLAFFCLQLVVKMPMRDSLALKRLASPPISLE
jgi:hypothetical protein